MKQVLITFFLVSAVLISACSKSETPDPAQGNPFHFNSLVAADTMITVNDTTTITANAIGDGLTYKWSASYGTFIGSGSKVIWTVCHKDKFTISCEVTDQYEHSETKTVFVYTKY